MSKVQEIAEQISKDYDLILGGTVGSYNFGLNDEMSDLDIRYYTMPTLQDLIGKRKRRNLYVIDNCDTQVQDIRRFPYMVRMGDLNMISVLFADEKYINPKYEAFAGELMSRREEIAEEAHSSIFAWGHAMFEKKMGQLTTYKATETMYMGIGYNTKNACQALYHIKLVGKYMYNLNYHVDKPLESALDCSDIREEVLAVKHGKYTLEEFKKMAEQEYNLFANMRIASTNQNGNIPWLTELVNKSVEQAVTVA